MGKKYVFQLNKSSVSITYGILLLLPYCHYEHFHFYSQQNNNMILQVVLPQNFSTATLDSVQGSLLSPQTTDSYGK